MGKRSDFERAPRDLYPTPEKALLPLLSHLPPRARFIEPCAGKGDLVRHLVKHQCIPIDRFDIQPVRPLKSDPEQRERMVIRRGNAATYRLEDGEPILPGLTFFITNPPWKVKMLHPIILNLWWQLPTWLLLSADWKHCDHASPYLPMCRQIVSVGRVRWMPGTKNDGKDNAAWYLFDAEGRRPSFQGRR
jgi:hypothetical protein